MPLLPRPQTALRTSQTILQRRSLSSSTCTPHSLRLLPATWTQTPKTSLSSTQTRNAGTQSTTAATGAASQTQHGSEEHTGEHGHSHDMYEPPTGWLWGVRPGEEYEKEGWEGIWYWGFYGSLGLAAVAYAWKPDSSIETWALEEAKRRLQAEGTLPEDE